jgi:hypothetical protein
VAIFDFVFSGAFLIKDTMEDLPTGRQVATALTLIDFLGKGLAKAYVLF